MGGCIHIDKGEGKAGAKLRFRKSAEDLGREKTERVRYGIKSGGTNAPRP